jgi:catechol 2,3-dioxygenase-like lactoylglutathione lyase family enzyme
MAVHFNHTIVHSRDPKRSASFLCEILGLPGPKAFGPFHVVELENGASLDFLDAGDHPFIVEHYAFLIGETDFDVIFARIRERRLAYWADPYKQRSGEINRGEGGRGFYFEDPDGHLLEVLTRPYGSAAGS